MSDSVFGVKQDIKPGYRVRYKNTTNAALRQVNFILVPSAYRRWLWFIDGVMLSDSEYSMTKNGVVLNMAAVYPGQTIEGVYLGDTDDYAVRPAPINRFATLKQVKSVVRGQTDIALSSPIPVNVYQVDVFVGGLYQHLGSYSILNANTVRLASPFHDATGEVLVVAHLTPYDQDPTAF